tara:strand:+ start:347 stop:1723 length:1377 start_codon:yes stop_codon:yes gene_type:complete
MMGATIISKVFKFIMMLFVARYFSPEIFGEINYIIVLAAFCFSFTEVGLSTLVNREYQQGEIAPDKLIAAGWMIKIVLVALNALVAIVVVRFIPNHLLVPFIIFFIMNIIDSLKLYKIALVRTQNNREYEAICVMIETILTSIVGILIIWKTANITLFACGYLGSSIMSSIYIWNKASNISESFLKAEYRYVKQLLKKIAPFIISAFLIVALTSMDTLMIQWMDGAEGVGFYQASIKITETILIIPVLYMTTIFPFTSKYAFDELRLIKILKESISILAMIGFPIVVGGIYLSKEIILSIYTASYFQSIILFKYLLISIVPIFFSTIFNGILLSTKQERKSVAITATAFLINIGLNIYLIPKMGALGAVYGTLISRSMLLLILWVIIASIFKQKIVEITSLVKYGVFSVIMMWSIMLIKIKIGNVFLLILFGAFAYMACLVMVKDKYFLKVKDIVRKV